MIAIQNEKFSNISKKSAILICIILIISAFALYCSALYDAMPESTFDDAYIFVRYALHFLDGKGIAWNPDGIQQFGASSLPYMLLIAAFLKISPMAAGTTILLVSWIVGLASLLLLWRICLLNVENSVLRNYAYIGAYLFPMILSLNIFPMNAVTGMDTTLSFASHVCLIGAVLSFCKQPSAKRMLLLVSAAGMTFMIRTDNAVCALLFPVMCISALHPKPLRRWTAWFAAGFCILFCCDALLKYSIFGHFFPLGAHAKTFSALVGYVGKTNWNHVIYLQNFLTNTLLFFFTLVICIEKASVSVASAFILPITITFAGFFSFVPIMGFDARYQCPFLPYMMVGSLLIFDRFLSEHLKQRTPKKTLIRFLSACILFTGLQSAILPKWFADTFLYDSGIQPVQLITKASRSIPKLDFWENIVGFAAFLRHLPRTITVAATEHGYVGAANPDITIIDLSGLNDSKYAQKEFPADELIKAKADIIWLPPSDYTSKVSSILTHPRFLQEYELYAEVFNFGVALARNSRYYDRIRLTLINTAAILYPGIYLPEHVVNNIVVPIQSTAGFE